MNLRAPICLLLTGVMLANTSACGTLMHPERKGQTDGNLDVGIAVLDGVGLLFLLIPGIIAYAVDFSNGTIYLPGGKSADAGMREVKVPKGQQIDQAYLERVVQENEHLTIHMQDAVISQQSGATPQQIAHHVALLGDERQVASR